MKRSYILLPLLLFIFSCGKTDIDKHPSQVFVRIQNAAGFTLENAHLAAVTYGTLLPGITTEYKVLNEPIYGAYCNYNVNAEEVFAGYGICGSPLPPAFEAGYYTFTIQAPVDGFSGIVVTKQ